MYRLILFILFALIIVQSSFANKVHIKEIISSDDTEVIWENEEFKDQIHAILGTGFVFSLDYSPDGQKLLVTSSFGLEIYNREYQLEKRIFTNNLVKDAVFSPKGDKVASISKEALKIWDIEKGEILLNSKNNMLPKQVVFSNNGEYAAYCGQRFRVKLVHTETGSVESILKNNNYITAIAFHPTEDYLISVGRDWSIRKFDIKTRTEENMIRAKGSVTAMSFSPDGTKLYYATEDRFLHIYDIKKKKTESIKIKLSAFQSMSISPDGQYLTALTQKNTFFLWDLKANKLVQIVKPEMKTPERYLNNVSVAFHPEGQEVAYVNERNEVCIVTVPDGKEVATLIHSAFGSFSSNLTGEYLIATPNRHLTHKSRFFNLEEFTSKIIPHDFPVHASVFHASSKYFLLAGESQVSFRKLDDYKEVFSIIDDRIGYPYAIAYSPRLNYVALSSNLNNMMVFNLKQKKLIKILQFPNPVLTLAFDYSGKRLIAGNNDLMVFNLDNWKARIMYSYIGGTNSMDASLSRNWVVLGDVRKLIHLVNIEKGDVRSRKKLTQGKVPVAFDKDGRYVAYGGYGIVGYWDIFKDRMTDFTGYKAQVEKVAFSRDQKYIYSLGREDGLIFITKREKVKKKDKSKEKKDK